MPGRRGEHGRAGQGQGQEYQVGFGDCFLLSLAYDEPLPDDRAERHILIDYGSTPSARENRAKGRMKEAAPLPGAIEEVARTTPLID